MATKKSDEFKGAAKKTTAKTTKVASAKPAAAKPAAARPASKKADAAPKAAKTAKTTKASASTEKASSKAAKATEKAAKASARGAKAKDATELPAKRTALAIAEAALEKKAVNVQIIDVVGKVDYADYLVVASGRSDRQVAAIARGVAEDVERAGHGRCTGIEGLPEGAWVLMDFGDVVVHVFHEDVRGYYDLESLWIDAGRVPVPNVTAENL